MEDIENLPADGQNIALQQKLIPRASDWFWQPWYAKLLWVFVTIYWVSLYATMLVPAGSVNKFVSDSMILLVFLFNPITIIAILGFGFFKAKVARGDWVVVPGVPPEIVDRQKSEQEAAYLNPVDIRSGYLHQQYMDRPRRHPTDRVDT